MQWHPATAAGTIMQIQSSRFQPRTNIQSIQKNSNPEAAQQAPEDSFTFRMSRRKKRKLITAGSALVGAGIGSVVTANFTSGLSASAASIAGGISGGAIGGIGGAVATVAVVGAFSEGNEGFGGLAKALGAAVVGGAAGVIGGAIGGSMLGTGTGNILGYAAGAIAGGLVGGFAAKGMMNN